MGTQKSNSSTKAISNRDKKRSPKLGKGYCFKCDRALVGFGSKCPVCGDINGNRRNKK